METIQTPWAAADEPTESPGRGERLPEVIKGGPAAFPALEPLCQAPTSRSLNISVFIDLVLDTALSKERNEYTTAGK